MTTTTSKQRALTHLLGATRKSAEPVQRPVFEQVVYGTCRENATCEQADLAFANLKELFFDWNEIRVSSSYEIAEALGDLTDAEVRAERILAFLQDVFETTFSFDLESLHKKGVKQAVKSLIRHPGVTEFVCAWVTQQTLEGHAIPLDVQTQRVLTRLGLIEAGQEDLEAVRTSLEHQIPKAKGTQFTEMVSQVASEFCLENEPNCARCPLRTDCVASQELAPARAARGKPR
jgi:endonuclease III